MARLPKPGSDQGEWGEILNDFLMQSHTDDGKLKDNSITPSQLAPGSVTNAAIASNSVTNVKIADGTISSAKLDSSTQDALVKANTASQPGHSHDGRYIRTVNGSGPDGDGNVATEAAPLLSFKSQPAGGSGTSGTVLVVGEDNAVASDLGMAAVIGGGKPNYENVIGGQIGNVDTGASNLPTVTGTGADFSFILGGYDNVNNAHSTIIAGYHCKAEGPNTTHNLIAGGSKHSIGPGVNYSSILGGTQNTVTGNFAAVIAGAFNKASAASIVAGYLNEATGSNNTISGGRENKGSGAYSVVSGGYQNNASGNNTSIGGGGGNAASANYGTVAGGLSNAASGNYGNIAGGRDNTASGQYSAIVGGQANIAAGLHSVAMGTSARTDARGSIAHAAGHFTTPGDAQRSQAISRREVVGASLTEIYVAGSAERLILPDHTTWLFEMNVVARATNGESAAYKITGAIERGAGASTTSMLSTPTVTIIGEDAPAWDIQVSPLGSTIGAFQIRVSGEDGKTIRWVVSTSITAVTNPTV